MYLCEEKEMHTYWKFYFTACCSVFLLSVAVEAGTGGGPYYVGDVQPILADHCGGCHTGDSPGDGRGSTAFGSFYSDAVKAARPGRACDAYEGTQVYDCIIARIQDGSMPNGRGPRGTPDPCSGDPAMDAGNDSCLTQEDQDTITNWIAAGAPFDASDGCCGAPLVFHAGTSRISDTHAAGADSPRTTANLELGAACLGETLGTTVEVSAVGEEGTVDVFLDLISETSGANAEVLFPDAGDSAKRGSGVQGFSISVAIDNLDFAGGGFDTADTAMALNPLWMGSGFGGGSAPGPTKPFPSLFISATTVDPAANDGQEGIIIAFVNCLDGCDGVTQYGEFPATGTESMVKLLVKTDEGGVPEDGVRGCVRYVEGLKATATAVPAESVLTVAGDSFPACNRDQMKFNIDFGILEITDFLRCDPNEDGKTDLGDTIYIINDIFRERVAAGCEEALNCNGQDGADLADVSYSLMYLYGGGAPPPSPFGACGADPEVDCREYDGCAIQ